MVRSRKKQGPRKNRPKTGRCKSRRKLEQRITTFETTPMDKQGEFIPICTYEPHRGVLKNGEHFRCQRKKCSHYGKLYLSEIKTPYSDA